MDNGEDDLRADVNLAEARRAHRITPTQLRAEEIVDVGAVPGTAVLFVITDRGIHLFHALEIPGTTYNHVPAKARRPRVSRIDKATVKATRNILMEAS